MRLDKLVVLPVNLRERRDERMDLVNNRIGLGIWINLGDAKYYKNIMDLQKRYIKHLHRKIDGEENDNS